MEISRAGDLMRTAWGLERGGLGDLRWTYGGRADGWSCSGGQPKDREDWWTCTGVCSGWWQVAGGRERQLAAGWGRVLDRRHHCMNSLSFSVWILIYLYGLLGPIGEHMVDLDIDFKCYTERCGWCYIRAAKSLHLNHHNFCFFYIQSFFLETTFLVFNAS